MADTQDSALAPMRPEAIMETAQHNLACWSRAWTQIASGLMSAEIAQLDLVRSFYGGDPATWARPLQAGDPQAAARDWMETSRAKFDTAIRGYRRIGDELASTMFDATQGLLDGLTTAQEGNGGASVPQKAGHAEPKAAKLQTH